MPKSHYYATTTIAITTIIFTIIILYPLLPTLAHDEQQLAYQTITTKNQINNIQKRPMSSYNFSTYTRVRGNNTNNNNNNLYNRSSNSNTSSSNTNYKVVILNFYDDDKSQITNAKPILDKYGFKGTFFIVCSWAGAVKTQSPRMTWQDVNQLYREGHDIESHSMTHKRLDQLSASALDYEVGQSKQCIYNHVGVKPTVFSPPHSAGWDNATVINTIAKNYDLSVGGFVDDVMFLHCYGWKQQQYQQQEQQYLDQKGCRTYSDNGTLNYANRYDIKESPVVQGHSNDTLIFDKFVNLANREKVLNNSNNSETTPMNSILVLGYHNIDNNLTTSKDTTDIALFDKEMKYLHDNGFRVITMSDLGYNENSKSLYIRNNSK
jgi:peptidoglycan/xylan/chitin deacetylase (PgdA/CDA1 family)